jgi:hypothetical protein
MAGVLSELVSLAGTVPTALELKARFASRSTAIAEGNEDLDMPPWAHSTSGPGDIYLTLSGDLAGVRLSEDPRGWGTEAEFAVKHGTLAEAEAAVGPTKPERRGLHPPPGGPRRDVRIERARRMTSVTFELDEDDPSRVVEMKVFFSSYVDTDEP